MTREPAETGGDPDLAAMPSNAAAASTQAANTARYADENAKGWIVELDELRTYAAQATASPGGR